MNLTEFDRKAKAAATALARPLRLKEFRLPAGDHRTLNVGSLDGGWNELKLEPEDWLREGYEGARFIGHDRGTSIRATSHDGIAVKVGRHAGCVQLDNLHVVSGYSRGLSIGLQNTQRTLTPEFLFRWRGGSLLVPPPEELGGKRAVWGIFGYQFDCHLADLEIDATFASEHAMYGHGCSKWGRLRERLNVVGSGGEGLKERPDATETAWAGKDVFIIDRDVRVKNWYQKWSNRGGAAFVFQNPSCHYLAERCEAWGGGELDGIPAHQRGKAWMFSAEGSSYDIDTGKVDKAGGHGMGYVMLRQCIAAGFSEADWHNQAINAGRWGGQMKVAKGVMLDQLGVYGAHRIVSLTEVDEVRIRRCNTPTIRDWCGRHGIDTSVEANWPTATKLIPLSQVNL